MCGVDQSAKNGPIKDSFHVLKTTDEAPRCAFTDFSSLCSCTSCWMAEQTDESAEKPSAFDFAQRTQPLTFLLEFSSLPHCDGVLFLDWCTRLWCHVLYLHWAGHLANHLKIGAKIRKMCPCLFSHSDEVSGYFRWSVCEPLSSASPVTEISSKARWKQMLRCDWVENVTRTWHEWV